MESVEVAAGLIEEKGRYLVTQRMRGVHLGLYWEFPGGKREIGESLEECLIREIWEELEIKVAVGSLVGKTKYEYSDHRVALHFHECRIIDGIPKTKGCHDLKWLAPDEMDVVLFPPADVEIIKTLKTLKS